MNDEKDLYIECKIRDTIEYDEDYEEIVTVNDMDVKCVINKSRILVNIPSIKELVELTTSYLKFLYGFEA